MLKLSLHVALLLLSFLCNNVSAQSCQTLSQSGNKYTTTGAKRQYQISCESDMNGAGDIANKAVKDFAQCMETCDTTSNCVAATYYQGNSVCYMKSIYARDVNPTARAGFDFAVLTSLTKPTISKALDGSWGPAINFPIVPVAAAVVPQTGKLFVWSAAKPDMYTSEDPNAKYTLFAEYNPQTGQVSSSTVSNTGHDMFCPGISFDVNGRIIVSGGSTAKVVSIYNPATNAWSRAGDLQVSRGYQSSTTLSNGKIFTIGGSWSGGRGGKIGEVYDPTTNLWTTRPGCPVDPIMTADQEGVYRADNHAWLFGWKDGSVFHAGPSKAMHWFGTNNNGTITNAGTRANGEDAMCGPAVMYDVGKIMSAGGSPSYSPSRALKSAHMITLGTPGTAPTVQQLSDMSYPRALANSVVLPTGDVLITGGQSYAEIFTDNNPTQFPELWSPKTSQFRVLNSKEPTPRTYHSVSILLPDATVFSGGGGLCGSASCNHFDGRIFSPPYLFKGENLATRPIISAVSGTTFLAGASFTVTLSAQPSTTPTFAIIRVGTVTHSVNTDQRRIPLVLTKTSGRTYTLQLPGDYGVVLPGYYYLFAMDGDVPSVSKIVQVRL